MSAAIEVLAVRPLPNAGNLKALASVRLGGVVVHDCKIVQQPGQKAWVGLPQKEFTTKTGEKKYTAVVEVSEPLRREISRVVLAAWERGGT